MKVGLNSAITCQRMRFGIGEQSVPKRTNNASTTFKSTINTKPPMSVNEKYELAKQIIVAQNQIIDSLRRQDTSKKEFPSSNLLNKLV